MPSRPVREHSSQTLRPYSAREIDLRLDEIIDDLARAAHDAGRDGPRMLDPVDVVRCLAPIGSRN